MLEIVDTRSDIKTRIIDVAARFITELGPSAVTTRAVADAAGVQPPTIYRLFGDKDGLLDAVAEHVMATYTSAKAARVETALADRVDPLDDLAAGWQTHLEFGLANPAVFRLLNDPDRARSSPAAVAGMRVLEARVHRVAETGRLRVSEQRAVALIHAAGVGTVQTLLATPPAQRDPGVADDMWDAVLGQILVDVPPRDDDGPLATTIAFRATAPRLGPLSDTERALLLDWLDRVINAG